jgi:hypothetical protein
MFSANAGRGMNQKCQTSLPLVQSKIKCVGGGLLLVNIPESFKSRFRQPISEEIGQGRVQVARSEFSLHRTRRAHFLNYLKKSRINVVVS